MKNDFFDRKTYLETLEKRVIGLKDSYRQNIAMIGDEGVGKTSIIFKFLNDFYDSRIITLYLEVQKETFPAFARRFIGILLYNFLANSGIALKEDIGYLTEKSERFIPRTVEKIGSILSALDKRKKEHIFTELLSLCELIKQETDKSCVVIFDEFLDLEELGIKDLYRDWSRSLISQKNTMYIITSSMKFKAGLTLSKNLSLLFGNFEVINVEPFDIRTSEQYLEGKLNLPGLKSGDSSRAEKAQFPSSHGLKPGNFCEGLEAINAGQNLRDFIIHFTGGSPYYLELISDALKKQNDSSLADVMENLLFESYSALSLRFAGYIRRLLDTGHKDFYLSMLYLVASGINKSKDIMQTMRKPKKEFISKVNRLLEAGFISRSGDFLKLNDRVFGFWLKFVYQEKQLSLTYDAKNQKEKLRNAIQRMLQDYSASARRPVIERITEVLRLFENEVMQLERKRVKLSHFREIKPLEFNNPRLKEGLIGRGRDSLWIMGFKNEQLNEEDIAEFSKECKKYRHKLQRKIIVTLNDIDSNTRLRALDEKIWTWDINNLNQILDLFSKPWLVV